jgi:hypothetical protein
MRLMTSANCGATVIVFFFAAPEYRVVVYRIGSDEHFKRASVHASTPFF